MGGYISTPATIAPSSNQINLSSYAMVPQQVAQQAQTTALQAAATAERAATVATSRLGWLFNLVIFVAVALGLAYLVDYLSIKFYSKSTFGLLRVVEIPGEPGQTSIQRVPIGSELYNRLIGTSGSGDLLPQLQDAQKEVLVSGQGLPLSSDNQGHYGIQWWMFVQDWNYGYGKEKSVITRVDPTNKNIMNPKIYLHPTDNTLVISVSVHPDTEGGSSTSEPASSQGSTAATDDVFICEVPRIPLQTWFSVGVSVFGRNLEVYIDGQLVKACLLSGVPKAAVGDLALTSGGGFSGYMCNLNYFARMLTPGDASNFHSAGTDCRDKIPANGIGTGSAGTGYLVKLGFYDTAGKTVSEYTF